MKLESITTVAATSAGNVVLIDVVSILIVLVLGGLLGAFMFWGMFYKAGVPGWWSIIPIVGYMGVCRVAQRPTWWVILLIVPEAIPVVGWAFSFVIWVMLCAGVSRTFGHGVGFAIGLTLLPIVFYPILSYGSRPYLRPQVA